MTLWCLDALLSVGAIGRGYATTLGELGSHRHGQRGAKRGGLLVFVVKTDECLCEFTSLPIACYEFTSFTKLVNSPDW